MSEKQLTINVLLIIYIGEWLWWTRTTLAQPYEQLAPARPNELPTMFVRQRESIVAKNAEKYSRRGRY
jgi:hypothetical protein